MEGMVKINTETMNIKALSSAEYVTTIKKNYKPLKLPLHILKSFFFILYCIQITKFKLFFSKSI